MASRGRRVRIWRQARGPTERSGPEPRVLSRVRAYQTGLGSEGFARASFIWPALLVVLFLSIFPLLFSLYMSLSRLRFVPGGIGIDFVGLDNFRILLFGTDRTHFIGLTGPPSVLGWLVFGAGIGLLGWLYVRAFRGGVSPIGLVLRGIATLFAAGLLWLAVQTLLSPAGRPGTLMVTIVYVAFGISVQYLLGLGLALLATQRLPGRRFFRVVFLLPMMITPVGVAYMFRMLTDTGKGPLEPLWEALGLSGFSWVNDPWGARMAIMIGDIWQWTPFMFIVLLAALEAQDVEPVEAALVDGGNRLQIFRFITLPAILPVTTTLILIRLIEGFKIVDLPNVMTNGGPGTATESLTLHAFVAWRALNLGGSAAIAYTLLFVVTVTAIAYINLVRARVTAPAT